MTKVKTPPRYTRFDTFAILDTWMKKARDPKKGRTASSYLITGNSTDGYTFELAYYGTPRFILGVYRPDNVFEFTAPNGSVVNFSNSLAMTLDNVVPLSIFRKAKARYNVRPKTDKQHDWRWKDPKGTKYQEYYEGLEFDCVGRKVLNPTEPVTARINKDNRKVWVSALRKFRVSLMVKARMGVIDTLLAEINPWNRRRYGNNTAELLSAIKAGAASNEVIGNYICNMNSWVRSESTGQDVAKKIMSTIHSNSVELRKAFGVFEDA
jgi:hypothetical protein